MEDSEIEDHHPKAVLAERIMEAAGGSVQFSCECVCMHPAVGLCAPWPLPIRPLPSLATMRLVLMLFPLAMAHAGSYNSQSHHEAIMNADCPFILQRITR